MELGRLVIHQGFKGPFFDDLAVAEHTNHVRMSDGGQPMSDHEHLQRKLASNWM